MATVMEMLTVPRSSSFGTSLSTPTTVSSISCSQNVSSLRAFKGLRIQLGYLEFGNLKNARVGVRGGSVVCQAQEATLDVPSITDKTWQSLVLESDLPVLVEFWAPWCGPCRMIHPVIGEISKQYEGKLRCFKVNTDDCSSTATTYGIRSIPTIMIFKKGEKKDTIIGAVPKSTLTSSIEKYL